MQKRTSFLLLLFFIPILIGTYSCFTNHSQERDTNVVRLNFGTNEYDELILATELPEPIIKDFSKINLVIFSASWCAPCIAEIPILKKIAEELSDKIGMVYVSMDETTTVDAWKKLMINKEITWRSVLAAYNLEEINQQFFTPGLPTVLMVYPDGKFETIEVRYDADLKKLYEIAGNQ